MEQFTPFSALVGGALIGLSASVLLVSNGRIAGISGMIGGLLRPGTGSLSSGGVFLLGLIAAGIVGFILSPLSIGAPPRSLAVLALAGLLVGAGTRLANGCTSGHGVCGISRGSPRSVVATLVFLGSGIATVTLLRLLGVGA